MGKNIIIFDLGGVLFSEGTQATINDLKKIGIDEKILIDIYRGELSWELRKGTITPKKYWEVVKKRYPEYPIDFKNEWYSRFIFNEELFERVMELQKQYHFDLGIISGNLKERVDYLDKKHDFLKYFTIKCFSYEYKLNKVSDQLIIFCSKLFKKYSKKLYVDDMQDCVEEGKAAGFETIKFTNIKKLESKIINYFNDED